MRQKYLIILASWLLLLHSFKCSFDTRNLRHGTLWIVCSFSCHLYLNIQPYPTDTIRATMLGKASYFTHLGACFLQETSCLHVHGSDPLSSDGIHDEFHSHVWPLVISTIHSTKPEASKIQTSSTNLSPWMAIDSLPGWVGRRPRDGFLGWNQKLMWGVWSVESLSNGLHLEADVKSCNTCGWMFFFEVWNCK